MGRLYFWLGRINMSVLVTNLKAGLSAPEEVLIEKGIRRLGVERATVQEAQLYKKSLDARKRGQVCFVGSVLVKLSIDEETLCRRLADKDVQYRPDTELRFPHGTQRLKTPIYIAGFGPAGIFCAYALAQEGYRPIVLERGYDVERRVEAVERFWKHGKLNTECNVQFGEGGAGTFSDGKLTTRISDERCGYVLERFVEFGAPPQIVAKAKPHIGTDKLRGVIKRMRQAIIKMGGEVRFGQRLDSVRIENGKLKSITVNGEEVETGVLVAALGHSARDTFQMLLEQGVAMEAKSFSIGMRIEHLQSEIDKSLYGELAGHPALPVGEYQLSYRENGRGVYTFCMCPGGLVVPSSSSEGTVVTNGMSEYRRDRKNANAAVAVSVTPQDFGTHPMDGVRFQSSLETSAFRLGGGDYRAVGTTVGEFLKGGAGLSLGRVEPSYALGVTACSPDKVFPPFVTEMLRKGLLKFDRKLHGFAAPDSVLTGVETRTSSPLRILRDGESMESISASGIYPCGEGAGYAGGIMSAAVDGLRVAQKIISVYAPKD